MLLLLLIELKEKKKLSETLMEIELQALNACATYLVNYPMKSIKAMATIGIKASLCNHIANYGYLTPVFGFDARSEAPEYIHKSKRTLASTTVL